MIEMIIECLLSFPISGVVVDLFGVSVFVLIRFVASFSLVPAESSPSTNQRTTRKLGKGQGVLLGDHKYPII